MMHVRNLQRRFLTRGGGEELVNVFDEEGARHLNEPLQQGAGAQNPLVHVASMLAKLDANSPLPGLKISLKQVGTLQACGCLHPPAELLRCDAV